MTASGPVRLTLMDDRQRSAPGSSPPDEDSRPKPSRSRVAGMPKPPRCLTDDTLPSAVLLRLP